MRHGPIAAVLAALLVIGAAAAQDPPGPAALDKTLKDVINHGAAIYNGGDPDGCYRVFQGSLETARPLLAYRPELQKVIDAAQIEAAGETVAWRRAWALRRALDTVRAGLRGAGAGYGTYGPGYGPYGAVLPGRSVDGDVAPATDAPKGPAPSFIHLRKAGIENGRLRYEEVAVEPQIQEVTRTRVVDGKPQAYKDAVVTWQNVVKTGELSVARTTFQTVSGKRLTAQEVAARLAGSGEVVARSADGKAIDPAYLRVLKGDAIVILAPPAPVLYDAPPRRPIDDTKD